MQGIPCELRGASVLVTGGAGFIGGHLVERLKGEVDVTVFDKVWPANAGFESSPVEYVRGDIRDQKVLERLMENVDVVFHLAALVSVPESIESPERSHSTNVEGTLYVLEAARKHDTRVVFASSAAIYGEPKYLPIDEMHPTEPTSPYGFHKLDADQYVRWYHQNYGLETVVLRYFNVYGPGQTGGAYAGVISTFIEQALAGEPITVHGDGEQTRDFVFVDDVVDTNMSAAVTENIGEAYNVATGESISIRELAELILELTDSASEIRHVTPREGDIDRSNASIEKSVEMLDFEPVSTLDDGLEQTIRWFDRDP